jgi:hypothetical protein
MPAARAADASDAALAPRAIRSQAGVATSTSGTARRPR